MKILGLINARKGSKGIPKKNIKLLNKKPLITYSIEAALKSKLINDLVVSTDCNEIAKVSKQCGASVPFLRPDNLALDNTLQIEVIKHAVNYLKKNTKVYDIIILLQPTCPLRNEEDIDNSIRLLVNSNSDTVISVMKVTGHHPVTMYKGNPEIKLEPLIQSNPEGVLRQEFNDIYWRNGAIYAFKEEVLLKNNSLYGKKIVGYEMPIERSANIDEPFDWDFTEFLLNKA